MNMRTRTRTTRISRAVWAATATLALVLTGASPVMSDSTVPPGGAPIYDQLDLGRPALASVQSAVMNADWTQADAALAAYFEERTEPVYFETVGSPGVVDDAMAIADGEFSFPGYQTVTMFDSTTGVIDVDWDLDWTAYWEDGQPATNAAALMYRFLSFGTLADAYVALDPADSRRHDLARAWMQLALDFISDKGTAPIAGAPNNRLTEAIRVTNWLQAFDVMRGDSAVSAPDVGAYLAHVHTMASEMAANVDQNPGNNWYISIARAVYLTAVYLPEFTDARHWRSKALAAATRYIDRNMRSDGLTSEPTVNYQRYTLDLITAIQEFGALNGDTPFSAAQLSYFGVQAEALGAATLPDGSIPLWGDAQGRFVDLGAIATIGEALDRDDLIWFGTGGAAGAPPEWTSRLYPSSYGIMRSGWGPDDDYLFIANHDTAYNASHRHPDDLSIIAYAYGRPLLVDPGVHEYSETGSAAWLRRTTEAHNTVEVGGVPQPKSRLTDPSGRVTTRWHANDGFSFYEGFHEDYDPVTHTRSVFAVHPGLWIVSDILTGSTGAEDYRQLWHVPADAEINVDATGAAEAGFGDIPGVAIVPIDPAQTSSVVHSDGFVSSGDGVLHSGVDYLSIDQTVAGDAVFDTVIVPGPAGAAPEVTASRLPTDVDPTVATAFTIDLDGVEASYYLSRETIPDEREFGQYSTDARVAYIESGSGGAPSRWSIAEGSTLASAATTLVESEDVIADLTVELTGTEAHLSASEPLHTQVRLYAPSVSVVTIDGAPAAFTVDGDYVVVGPHVIVAADPPIILPAGELRPGGARTWDFTASESSDWTPVLGTWSDADTLHNLEPSPVSLTTTGDGLSDVRVSASVQRGETARGTFGFGIALRYQDPDNYYFARIYRVQQVPHAQIIARIDGQNTILADEAIPYNFAAVERISATAADSAIELRVGGELVASAADTTLAAGGVGVMAEYATAAFDDVEVDAGRTWSFESDSSKGWYSHKGAWEVVETGPNQHELVQPDPNQNTGLVGFDVTSPDLTASVALDLGQLGSSYYGAGIATRCQDESTFYLGRVYVTPSGAVAELIRMLQGHRTDLATIALPGFSLANAETMEITASGDALFFAIDGVEVLRAVDGEIPSGGVCLQAHNAVIGFDDVRVTELLDPSQWSTWRGLADDRSGQLRLDGTGVTDAQVGVAMTPGWSDYVVSANLLSDDWGSGGSAGLVIRSSKDALGYRVVIHDDGTRQAIRVERIASGSYATVEPTILGEAEIEFDGTAALSLTVVVLGSRLSVEAGGEHVLTISDSVIGRGGVGAIASDMAVEVSNIQVAALTSHVQEPTQAARWLESATYLAGDRVVHLEGTYVATWWTRGDEPGTDPWGAWQEYRRADDGTAIWTPTRIFHEGDVVLYNGIRYRSAWWTRGQDPGAPGGPWVALH